MHLCHKVIQISQWFSLVVANGSILGSSKCETARCPFRKNAPNDRRSTSRAWRATSHRKRCSACARCGQGQGLPENYSIASCHDLQGLSYPKWCRTSFTHSTPKKPFSIGHNLWLHFGVDEHPFATYCDVHQGYRVGPAAI